MLNPNPKPNLNPYPSPNRIRMVGHMLASHTIKNLLRVWFLKYLDSVYKFDLRLKLGALVMEADKI